VSIVRGLAATVGYSWMWVPTSSNGASVGTVAPKESQLSYKLNHGVFVGGGYVFKGS
jgi:hypothetical protein